MLEGEGAKSFYLKDKLYAFLPDEIQRTNGNPFEHLIFPVRCPNV